MITDKAAKEAFVTGLKGTSSFETLAVIILPLVFAYLNPLILEHTPLSLRSSTLPWLLLSPQALGSPCNMQSLYYLLFCL